VPDETDGEVVSSLSRELVSGLAPEELPLYPSLLSQFQHAKSAKGKRGKKSSDDQLLGFGGAEAITMRTASTTIVPAPATVAQASGGSAIMAVPISRKPSRA
jgi:hypothetical protein